MKWFEHKADASDNKKIRRIRAWGRAKGGDDGAMAADGRYWTLLSVIARHGVFFRLPDDYGLDLLASDLMCSLEYLKEFLTLLGDINAIDKEYWQKGIIFCPKMAEHADRYTDELIKKILKEKAEGDGIFQVNPELYKILQVLAGNPDPRKRTAYLQMLHSLCTETGHNCPPPTPTPTPTPAPAPAPKDIARSGIDIPASAAFFFSCKYFEVDFDYRQKLAAEYPMLTDDLLKKEFSKMEDWISDNPKKKKFKANGHLANPKLFIKNWLERVLVTGQGVREPKGWAALREYMARRKRDAEYCLEGGLEVIEREGEKELATCRCRGPGGVKTETDQEA